MNAISLWDITLWWLVAGVVSAFYMRLFSKAKRGGLVDELKDLLAVFLGPIPIIGACIVIIRRAFLFNKLKKFASLTLVYFANHKVYGLYLNEELVLSKKGESSMRSFIPFAEAYGNFNFILASGSLVNNLNDLRAQEVKRA